MKNTNNLSRLPKCMLVMPTHSSFMEIDHDILRCLYHVTPIYLSQNQGKFAYACSLLKLALKLLLQSKGSITFVWFADYHAALTVAINKIRHHKTIVLIGGYDAVYYPELKMGVYSKPLRGYCNRYSLQHTDLIIANHDALIESQNTYYCAQGHADGIRHFIPNLQTMHRILYNGIRIHQTPKLVTERPLQILTIGLTPRKHDFINKGYDLLIEVASRNPKWQFVFVGISQHWLKELDAQYHFTMLPNIQIKSWIGPEHLIDLFLRSAVYVQASISEGMPNALIEAMYYGCVPVGSNVAGIPTVIDKYGKIVNHRDSIELEHAIAKAYKLENRTAIQEHIIMNFSFEKRKQRLCELLCELDIYPQGMTCTK